jgi:hypothetical protein
MELTKLGGQMHTAEPLLFDSGFRAAEVLC